MYIKPLRKWLRRNPIKAVIIAILAFLLIQLPPWVADVWSLASERPLVTVLKEQLYGFQVSGFSVGWVTTPIGLVALFTIIGLLLTGGREAQPVSVEADSAKLVEGLNERVHELENENIALEKARKHTSDLYEAARKDNDTLQMCISSRDDERESYKWLYEIADQDKKFIDQRVQVTGCEIVRHDLRNELYVDFKFTILNASVYGVAIDEESIKGKVLLNSRLLSKPNMIIENGARYCGHAESKSFTVRQWLDRDEIADILKAPDEADDVFRLGGLHIPIKGVPDEAGVYPRDLKIYGLSHPSKLLREFYKKLGIDIPLAKFVGHWKAEGLDERALLVNMQVHLSNPRPVLVAIQKFKVSANISGRKYEAYAEIGEIYEDRGYNKEGVEVGLGKRLQNLNPRNDSILPLESKQSCDGWLQFIIKDVGFDEPHELPAILIVIDKSGEEHPAACLLIYTKS